MKIYLSYGIAGKDVAEYILLKLDEAGHQALSSASIAPGEGLAQVISETLGVADAFIFIISPESRNNNWLTWEWRTALERSWEKPGSPCQPPGLFASAAAKVIFHFSNQRAFN